MPCKKLLFSLSVQNEEFRTKIRIWEFLQIHFSRFLHKLTKVSEIVIGKIHAGLHPDSDASYNCGFSKGKWPSASHHDEAAFAAAIHGTYRLTRTSCSRCPCGSTTFQENLTVSAASTPEGAVLFCWVMKNIPII